MLEPINKIFHKTLHKFWNSAVRIPHSLICSLASNPLLLYYSSNAYTIRQHFVGGKVLCCRSTSFRQFKWIPSREMPHLKNISSWGHLTALLKIDFVPRNRLFSRRAGNKWFTVTLQPDSLARKAAPRLDTIKCTQHIEQVFLCAGTRTCFGANNTYN